MWLWTTVICVSLFQGRFAATDFFYTAGVFEHAVYGTKNDSVSDTIETNLRFYENAMRIAKLKGVDIMVFPEYGIFPFSDRARLKKFMEPIPDPTVVDTTPCIEDAYPQKSILRTLSCMARNHSMFVVANMGDLQNCEGHPNCSSDGDFQFNTNVVFNRNGKLLVRYHKENLFFEVGLDEGEPNQNTVFETDFGTFATYVCFDITFETMENIARYPHVDGVAFSTKWFNILPQLTAQQLWLSWALKNNVTFLAANLHLPGEGAIGSGIFHPRKGVLGYTFNPDSVSKLVVSTVPRRDFESFSPDVSHTDVTETGSRDYVENGKDIPLYCSAKLLGPATDKYTDYRCLEADTANYTLVKLTEPSGHLEACNNGMCCTLDYSAEDMKENFYLGVLNDTYFTLNAFHFCEETCLLVRCEPFGKNPCGIFPLRSETVFNSVHLKGNFTTDLVYPSILENKMGLTPISEWTYDLPNNTSESGQIVYSSHIGRKIVSLGFKGRCRDREPFNSENLSLRPETGQSLKGQNQ